MKKRNLQDNRKICHIPLKTYNEIKRFGDNDFQKGLQKTNCILHNLNFDFDDKETDDIKKQVLMNDCNKLMEDLRNLYSRNHFRHFGEFPVFFAKFLDTGGMDINILKQRHKETTFDELEVKDESK